MAAAVANAVWGVVSVLVGMVVVLGSVRILCVDLPRGPCITPIMLFHIYHSVSKREDGEKRKHHIKTSCIKCRLYHL